MIKLHSHYSKKIPGILEYSSEQFSASIEIEVADEVGRNPQKLHSSLKWLWGELRQAVEFQIQQGKQILPEKKTKALPVPNTVTPEKKTPNKTVNQGNTPNKASNKQLKYLIQLAKKQGYDFQALGKLSQEQFSKNSVYNLSISEASSLIDQLKEA